MGEKKKPNSLAESLGNRSKVTAFLEAGTGKSALKRPKGSKKVDRIAVTLRLPRCIAHALIDASAERRKNREKAWSQQDIAAEALAAWLER